MPSRIVSYAIFTDTDVAYLYWFVILVKSTRNAPRSEIPKVGKVSCVEKKSFGQKEKEEIEALSPPRDLRRSRIRLPDPGAPPQQILESQKAGAHNSQTRFSFTERV